MIQYLINKMYDEKKTTINNIIVTTCILSVLAICVQIASRLMQMLKDDWYKNSVEISSNGDPFIREKMGVIIAFVFSIIAVIYIFCVVIYIIKIRLDIVKERSRMAMFKILGYINMQLAKDIFLIKVVEIIVASVLSTVVALLIWKVLCMQKIFMEFMTLLDDNMDFNIMVIGFNVIVLMILSFPSMYICIQRCVHLTDMKGED